MVNTLLHVLQKVVKEMRNVNNQCMPYHSLCGDLITEKREKDLLALIREHMAILMCDKLKMPI